VQATGLILVQLERLVLPHVLPLHDLATFGVLAAIVGSFFRVLQMSVGFSLVPRLRAAPDVRQRRRLVAKEARLVAGVVLLGSAAIWILTPMVEHWFLGEKYHLAGSLVLATLVSGVIKIFNAFSRAIAGALTTPRELSMVNLLGWISVGIGLVAAFVGARWGLAGVIYGVALGWAVRTMSALYVTARHLRLPVAGSAVEPAAS
jgi:O-antigen/teichoic acid export membrane protein